MKRLSYALTTLGIVLLIIGSFGIALDISVTWSFLWSLLMVGGIGLFLRTSVTIERAFIVNINAYGYVVKRYRDGWIAVKDGQIQHGPTNLYDLHDTIDRLERVRG